MALYRRNAVRFLAVLAVLVFSGHAAAYDFEGTVRVSGPPYPDPRFIPIEKKPVRGFPENVLSQSLLISPEGGLQNAVVVLEGGAADVLAGPSEIVPPQMELDQKDYLFDPHVVVLPAGASLKILNSDGLAHDVRAFNEDSKMLFRYDVDPGKSVEALFEKPGNCVLRCGLHHWMHAFVIVVSSPHYAVTDAHGGFRIEDVPPGNYAVRIWHEILGESGTAIEMMDSVRNFEYTYPSEIR